MASSTSTLTMKLLVDTKGDKVLFAEASKEVVDFLFNLLCLPLGTIIRLLDKKGMVVCLGNLYESVENLNETYMQPNQHKDVLLKPRAPISSFKISGLLPINDGCPNDMFKFYTCSNNHSYVTCDKETRCPYRPNPNGTFKSYTCDKPRYVAWNYPNRICGCIMDTPLAFVGNNVLQDEFPYKRGFVKEVVTYMVMDDLIVQPMSTISSITLLNKINIKEVGALQEKVVEFGMTQGIDLLKASLQSKMVLTSVFMKNKTVT